MQAGPVSTVGNADGTATLADVQVRGEIGTAPSVVVPTPFVAAKFDRRVIAAGDGPEVRSGDQVTIEYVGIDGVDGRTFDSSFQRRQASTFVLSGSSAVLPGMTKAVDGVKVGSRLVVALPPVDGFGDPGMASLGIGPTDTLVFVVDVTSAKALLTRAEGAAQPAKAGLPTVTLDDGGAPTVTIPRTAPPKALVVDRRIIGTGATVQKGQSVSVQYTGVLWPGGKVFDSTWDRGQSVNLEIGVGKQLKGLDSGLVGQSVGSQVLLVIPPNQGYGTPGNPSAGIKPTDTLVFVVDILDATGASADTASIFQRAR